MAADKEITETSISFFIKSSKVSKIFPGSLFVMLELIINISFCA
jgi:hypothetical protein